MSLWTDKAIQKSIGEDIDLDLDALIKSQQASAEQTIKKKGKDTRICYSICGTQMRTEDDCR